MAEGHHLQFDQPVQANNFSQYQEMLQKELALLTSELKSVGRINPDNKEDWEAVARDGNIDKAEEEERASEITDFEERSSVEFQLEERLNKIKAALLRMERDTYGTCIVCDEPIEEDRLNANPAATTCVAHKEI